MSRIFVKDKQFYKTLIIIALPVIFQQMITIGVNMMDTIMLGSYGETQISGSSLANEFINIYQILCMGMGGGCAVLTAQYWGSRQKDNIKKAITIVLRLSLIIATIFTIVTIFFADTIMSLFTTDAMVIEKGVAYFWMSLPTYALMGISLTLGQVLRSVRNMRIPLYASILSFVSNIFFNWVFIYGHLGAPEMQIEGAALGTVIARVFETALLVIYMLCFDKDIQYKLKDLLLNCQGVTDKFIHYSIPVIFSDLLLGIGNSMVSVVIGHISTAFVAANSIVAMIQRFITTINIGIGAAAATLTGNTLGAGQKEKTYAEAKTMLGISAVFGVVGGMILHFIGPIILSLYNITTETNEIAISLIDAISIILVFQCMQSVLTKGILRGGGDTTYCIRVDAVYLWLVSVPLGILTGIIFHFPPFIVYLCLKADWIIKSILCTRRLCSRKWLRVVSA